ncbi:MAG TPA: hypothetical protein VMT76_01780 [Puia sp.]|nr:hypothetical protein [Puia sp.]
MIKYKIEVEKQRIFLFVGVFSIGMLLAFYQKPLWLLITIGCGIIGGIINLSIKPIFLFYDNKFAVKKNIFISDSDLKFLTYDKIINLEYHHNRGKGADSITINFINEGNKQSYTYSTAPTKKVQEKLNFLKTRGLEIIED